jgi:hypothetical protein
VSSGIKNIFHKSSYELLIAGFPTYHKRPPYVRLNGVFPDFPFVPDCREREKRDIYAFKRGIAHPVIPLQRKEMV